MSASFLKQRKHKQFKYTSRYSQEEKEDGNSEVKSHKEAFSKRWNQERKLNANRKRKGFSMWLLLIILALLLIVMYMLKVTFI